MCVTQSATSCLISLRFKKHISKTSQYGTKHVRAHSLHITLFFLFKVGVGTIVEILDVTVL